MKTNKWIPLTLAAVLNLGGLTTTEAQISVVLTPEQEAQFERMQQENRRFFPPPEQER